MNSLPVDVLVIGGGIQGLVLMNELKRQGYSAVLTTNSSLGSGQTLHSHGLLNSGYWIIRRELRQTLTETVLPYVEEKGLQFYGNDQWFISAPAEIAENLRKGWETCGYAYEEVDFGSLPDGFHEGELRNRGVSSRFFRIKEYNYPKRQLVRLLSAELGDSTLFGDILSFHCAPSEQSLEIDSVQIRIHDSGEIVCLKPKCIVTAAGTGTKRLVQSLLAEPSLTEVRRQRAETQLEKVKVTKAHMICLRAPTDILPAASMALFESGLLIVAHVNQDHDRVGNGQDYVTWYVTPPDPDRSSYDDVPDDAHAEVNAEVTVAGINNLLRIYPGLRQEAEKPDSRLEFKIFAGYKQDIGEQPGVPACEFLEGFDNVIMTLPSISINAWVNARNALSLIQARVMPSETVPILPIADREAKVGIVNELADGVEWMKWNELLQAYPGIERSPNE